MGLHKFKTNKEERKLWFKNNKNKLIKIGTITMSVIVLVLGVVLFTMAKYKNNMDFEMINTKVGEFQTTDVKVVAYNYDGENHDVPPGKDDGYGAISVDCTNADGEWDHDDWGLNLRNITGKVKCDITFKQGLFFVPYLKGLTGSDVVQDDGTTDKNMRFVGSSPNNYVNLELSDGTTELFRVIGVFDSNSHGQNEYLVKLTKATIIGKYAWNNNNNNNWNVSNLNTSLNASTSKYAGSNYVQSVTWKTGATSLTSVQANNGTLNLYNGERSNTTSTASPYATTVSGKVGLPYASDFLLATDGYNGVTPRSTCITNAAPNTSNNQYWGGNSSTLKNCAKGSWLIITAKTLNSELWTMSAYADNDNMAYYIKHYDSDGSINYTQVSGGIGNLPTVYLKPNVICTNCSDTTAGTSTNPWTLSF